ncbi:elongation of very long chain fatty acids protein F [Drosophila elegans]|uniref:elongation of very long chain fatty acids protein F n=1 Tax=Drosophila elegans TaxID=30023 RepID=UPI0007E709F0|nr:elongation of very long chain fatty acids protein F [Drosophila elegans]
MFAQMMDFLNRTPPDPVRLPFTSSHWPVLAILTAYMVLIKVVGPRFMKNRKAYDLRGAIKAYNIVQIVYNIIMFVSIAHFMLGPGNYNFKCISNLPLDHEYKTWERWVSYTYFFNKLMDLLETFFFVLRKKDRQITFLHVFHHVYMVYICFMYMYYYGYGGHGLFLINFNVVVHIMMYAYYYQSSLGQDRQANLWWKKYITVVQLVQFVIVLSHCIYILQQPDCTTSRLSATWGSYVSVVFIVLFTNFYVRAYILPKKKNVQAAR